MEEINTAQPGGTITKRAPHIRPNLTLDIPILEVVRDLTFATTRHVEQMLRNQYNLTMTIGALSARINRLAKARLIEVRSPLSTCSGLILHASRLGLGLLESLGKGIVGITSESEFLASEIQSLHFLELNEIMSALMKCATVSRWYTDRRVRSYNLASPNPLQKDYDSVCWVKRIDGELKVGIEYERTLKTPERYKEIASLLAKEKQLDVFLYCVPTLEYLNTLARLMNALDMRLCFVSGYELKTRGAEAPTHFVRQGKMVTCKIQDVFDATF